MPEAKSVSRKWLYAVWIGASIIMVAYYGLWRYGAGQLEEGVHQWVGEQRAAGLLVEHGRIKRDGFPFFLRVHVDAPGIASHGAFEWRGEQITLDALPYDLNRLIISPSGKQTIASKDIGDWTVTADDMRLSIANDKERGWAFAMNIANAVALETAGDSVEIDELIYDLAPDAKDQTTLVLSLAGQNVSFAREDRTVAIDSTQTALSLTQASFLTSGNAGYWAGAGGALIVHGLTLAISDAEIAVTGKLGLDEQKRPEGVLNTLITRPAGLAPVIAASGALSKEEADAAAAGLALAAMTQGGKIERKVEFKDGGILVDGAKIANMPALR